MSEPRSALEEKVVEAALGARDKVVGLVTELVACDFTYLPGHADAEGAGRAVEAEVVDRLTAAVAGGPWFAERPPRFRWTEVVVPAEMPPDHPPVVTAVECAALVDRSGKPAGLDSWHDAASFTAGGTPTLSFGPDGIETAHAANERVSVQSLLDFTAAVAVMAMRWCGVARSESPGGPR